VPSAIVVGSLLLFAMVTGGWVLFAIVTGGWVLFAMVSGGSVFAIFKAVNSTRGRRVVGRFYDVRAGGLCASYVLGVRLYLAGFHDFTTDTLYRAYKPRTQIR